MQEVDVTFVVFLRACVVLDVLISAHFYVGNGILDIFIVKDTFIAYIEPKSGSIKSVILMDNGSESVLVCIQQG